MTPYDLLVIGGGVNGAGIARDAAGRGLSVLLCEKDDLAQGTSSRSGKLVHGGLRYLEYYEFRLVREALIEREVLLDAAPHIIWPMRFVLPHSPEQRPAWLVRLGLFLYDHLGGRKKLPATRAIDLASDPVGEPIKDAYTRAFEYSDCWVDDSRLVVLNALDAQARGADIRTRTAVLSARRDGDAWTVELGDASGQRTVRARCIVNAAGPWVEDVLAGIDGSSSNRRVRLVKGSHIVTRKFWDGDQAYLLQNHDKRVIFVNPYEGDLALIGTTDIAVEGKPEDAAIDDREIDYLLAVLARYFDRPPTRADIVHSFSGVRPLYDDNAENPVGGDARLHLRHRSQAAERRGAADPVDLRRQDHDLSQAGGACARQAGPVLPRHGEGVDRARAAARRRHGGFRRLARRLPQAVLLAAPRPRAALRPALRHARRRRCWKARRACPISARISAPGSMSARRASCSAPSGRAPRRTSSTAAPSMACI